MRNFVDDWIENYISFLNFVIISKNQKAPMLLIAQFHFIILLV